MEANLGGLTRGLATDRDRAPLWIPVFLGIGIFVYFSLPAEPAWWLGAVLVGAGALFCLPARRSAIWLLPWAAIFAAICGFAASQLRTHSLSAPLISQRVGPTSVSGRIAEVETLVGHLRLVVENVETDRLAPEKTPDRVRLRVRGDQPILRPGMRISVLAVLLPLPPPSIPGAFDFSRYAYFQGLGAVGFSLGRVEVHGQDPPDIADALGLWLADLRQSLSERIRARLDHSDAGAVAVALMTGEKGAIPAPVMAAVRDAGLAHLLAISGLHIGLVAGLLFFAVRSSLALLPGVALVHDIKKWAALVALLGAFCYAQITGATVPTQRAFLMTGLVLAAVLFDRRGISLRGVAWAATVILLLQPEAVLGASFQMSFAAVTCLVAVYESWGARKRRRPRGGPLGRTGLYFSGVAATTLLASFATAPFVIHNFNRVATFGLAANLLAVPVTALWIMPWALVAFFLMPFGLEGLALAPMGMGIDLVLVVAKSASELPGSTLLLVAPPGWMLAALTLGGLWMAIQRGPWRWVGSLGVAAFLIGLAVARPPDIMVESEAKLMAINLPDGRLAVSSLRAKRFERQAWLRASGQRRAVPWSKFPPGVDQNLACDPLACWYERRGSRVSLIRDQAAVAEDCRIADVVVSVSPLRGACRRPSVVIDRFDLWRKGGHAIWLDGDGAVRVKTVNEERGRRPWVLGRN